ncbi:MAG: hydroxymethylbilane synthase [Acidobacteriota bacterium]|jgi:hydroxymethylbilane synthase
MKIRIGSRGSALALAQTNAVAETLRGNGHEVEVVIIQTAGDRDVASKFSDIGAPGVFVREIEAALLGGDIDLAVHSYKDLPSAEPDGLHVAAIPERLDPADYLVARPEFVVHVVGAAADAPLPLAPRAVVGTASERRRALLHSLRPDLQLERIRGNVPTRLDKLREGPYQAIVLAGAGLQRLLRAADAPDLGLEDFVDLRLDPALFVPSPAQGAIALQCRREDAVEEALAPLHDEAAARPVRAERELLRLVDGGCSLPFGAWARAIDGGRLELHAVIEAEGRLVRSMGHGSEPEELAARVWEALEADGALDGVQHGEAVE